jgi:hypothetical protein
LGVVDALGRFLEPDDILGEEVGSTVWTRLLVHVANDEECLALAHKGEAVL